MAQNETIIDVEPQRVWDVLADGRNYGYWVVGSSEIRDVDNDWPAVGSRFHHKVGWGPLKVADHTRVDESRAPIRLKLRAKARPLGTAEVTMQLHPHARGTRVVMTEDAGDRLTALVFNPLTHLLVRGRNVESLRRLKELAEGRGPSPEEARTP
ncbi:MAG: SRPBCC family protein [Solirubrobacteraceae bacterium]|nr:SRPBCC family protein [Solirubrobacteraceae bacterium]